MKKLLLTLAVLTAGAFSASADSYTIQFKTGTSNTGSEVTANNNTPSTFIESGADYVASLTDFTYAYGNCTHGFKVGANKTAGSVTFNLSELGKVDATKIEVYASASKNATYQKLSVNGTEFSFTADDVNASFKVCEILNPGELSSLVLKKTNASTTSSQQGFVFINKIVVTYTPGASDLLDAGLSFSETEVQGTLGEAFTAPTLTKATSAEVTYVSSNTAVATVDETSGDITLLSAGTTVITASSPANDAYKPGVASYTLTVIDPTIIWAPNCTVESDEFSFVKISGDVDPWSFDAKYGLKASAYIGGKTNASDAVAASKVLDFTDYVAPMTLDYRQAINQFKIDNVLIAYTNEAIAPYLSVVAKAEGETEWTKIGDVNVNSEEGSKFGWDFFDGAQVDLAQYAGKKVQIGFRYVSTAECAGTWEIDNVVVRAKKNDGTVAIEDIEAADAPVEYYNLQGIRVANPTSGLYIKRQGNKVTKVIL